MHAKRVHSTTGLHLCPSIQTSLDGLAEGAGTIVGGILGTGKF